MTTIAVTNRKGGVGKTSMSLHIAAGLATVGYRVGLIDTDSQGHIAVSIGLEPTDALFDVLVDNAPLDDTHFVLVDPDKYSTPDNPARGELRILSSADKTYRIPHELGEFGTFALLKLIDRMKKEFDLRYIIIDTSPTLKDFDGHIYLATDAFVYVTEAAALSLHGLDKAIEQMFAVSDDRMQYVHRPTTVLGIIPNKKRNTTVQDIGLEDVSKKYPGLVWNPVKLSTLWEEASMMNQVLFCYAPSSEATQEAWAIVEQVAKAEQAWRTNGTN